MLEFKIGFGLCLIAVFIAGILAIKNFDKWFGTAVEMPSENESSLLLNKTQVILLWALALKLLATMVLIL